MRISIVGLLLFSATLASAGIVVDRVSTLSWFHRGIELAEEVKIHEGLPHPVFERDSYASERARDDTFEIAGDFLYEKPLEVPLNVLNEMLEMFYQRKVFNPPALGPMTSKLCGGFHADHAFIWKTGGKRTAAALLCYGCREIRLIGPEGEQVTADLQRLAFDEFRSRLNKLRTQRPRLEHVRIHLATGRQAPRSGTSHGRSSHRRRGKGRQRIFRTARRDVRVLVAEKFSAAAEEDKIQKVRKLREPQSWVAQN
jgi:hypothetical protein